MPITTITRTIADAPKVGEIHGFVNGGRSFAGLVVKLTPLGRAKAHVTVHIEISEPEHRRLLGTDRTG